MTGKFDAKWWSKCLFVLCCGAVGTLHAFGDDSFGHQHLSPYSASPPTAALAIALLNILLATMLWMRVRGRKSEAWALLGYGCWMVTPIVMWFYIVWYAQDNLFTGTEFLAHLMSACLLLVFVVGGLRSALRNRWRNVAGWWGVSFLLLLFLLPQCIYAPYYAGQRFKDRHVGNSNLF